MFKAESPPRPSLLATCIALALVGAYLFALRDYGFELSDEGTILYQIERTASGQIPYRDFSTGYTPGFFWINALVFRTMGESINGIRLFLIGIHLLTALGLLLIAGHVMRSWAAAASTLLWFAFLPVFPGRFCSFNIPYPAWYAMAGFVWSALAALRWRESGKNGWLALAAVCAAFALACKPNSGAFAFMALGLTILRRTQAQKDPLWWPVWAGIATLALLAFGFRILSRDFLIYLLPLALLQLLLGLGRLGAGRERDAQDGSAGAWAAVLLTGGVATLPWVTYFAGLLGLQRFIREVTLIGSGADVIYYIPFPQSGGIAMAAAAALSALLVLGLWLGRLRSARLGMFAAGLVAAAAAGAAAAALGGALAPEGIVRSIIWQLESAAFPLSLVVHWTCLLLGAGRLLRPLARSAPAREPSAWPTVEVLLPFSICMFLQLYPRADFMHLVTAGPLCLLLGFFLLEESLAGMKRLFAAAKPAWLARSVVLAPPVAILAILALRLYPNAGAFFGPRRAVFESERGRIEIGPGGSSLFSELSQVVEELENIVSAHEAVFTFPALAAVNFFSDRRAPFAHDYFFPGRPDHEAEARMAAALSTRPPKVIVTMHRDLGFFEESPAYYFLLRTAVRSGFRPLKRIGRFDIMVKRERTREASRHADSAQARQGAEETSWGTPLATPASPRERILLAANADAPAAERRAALAATLDSLAGERGLEELVAAAGLSRRQELLFLRAIRDFGDLRAASYLLSAFKREDRRIKNEAESAMEMVGLRASVAPFLWGGPGGRFELAIPGSESVRNEATRLLLSRAESPRARPFAARVLGFVGGRTAQASLLVGSRRAKDPAVKVACAEALLRLGAPQSACALVKLLGGFHPALRHLAPSLVVTAYRDRPAWVRPCLVRAISRGLAAPPRDPAVARAREALWIGAATGDFEVLKALKLAAASRTALSPAARSALRYAGEVFGGRHGG